ncbi:hypothetical protein O981_23310 [Mycobacterium avium 10-5560]|uniref:Uncharacterized protein n=1 Tax=Mycobacterium avium subsp. hominissuis TaxID=439334 RepID=A0AAC9L7K6_MYCAV|nr:hypothetical protein BS641_24525 [Mycobacterium avium subsp. hominissuis]ETB48627.1 hypothetical protein O981_23310 [Mycobacterium avium 10-5560]KDP02731.1 hypothetical protein MAV100_23035 [Mycobacterium avium subsp. hominissuis 100]PAZ99330.1 hypothetical protein CKJ74_21975 [Mycobacterium avium]PBA09172.1 hypothetical protein CKJ70_22475 [Mycobacterium avium]
MAVVCLREVKDRRGVVPDDALGAWETAAQAEADQLAEQRAGNPVVAWWYDLPTGLPEPLDKLGHDPAPRYVTVWSDDTVDASEAFSKARSTYERARHFSGCDHGYFRAKFDLAKAFGVDHA